jgi:hypothetical protein
MNSRALKVALIGALVCLINATVLKWGVNQIMDSPLNASNCRSAAEATSRGTLVCEMSVKPGKLMWHGQEIKFEEAWVEESVWPDHFLVWFPYYKRAGYDLLGLRLADEEWQLLTAYRSRPCLTLPGGQDKELTCLAGGNLRNAPIGVYFARLDGYDYSPLKMYIRGYLTQEQSEPITLTPKRGE